VLCGPIGIGVRTFCELEGLMEGLDDGAKPVSAVPHRVIAFGERCSKPLDFVPRVVLQGGQSAQFGAGVVEMLVAFLDLSGEQVPFRTSGCEFPVSLLQFGGHLVACGRLGAQCIDLIAKASDLGAKRFPFLRQGSNLLRGDCPQACAERLQFGRDAAKVFGESVALGLEPALIRFEQVVHDLKLFVFALEPVVLRSKLLVLGSCARVVAPVANRRQGHHRDRFRCAEGRLDLRLRRVCHHEGLIALVAADVVADVGAPDVQGRLASWADNSDPLDPFWSLAGWFTQPLNPFWSLAGWFTQPLAGSLGGRSVRPAGAKRSPALLAAHELSEVIQINHLIGRALGANRDEMRSSLVHGIGPPVHHDRPTSCP